MNRHLLKLMWNKKSTHLLLLIEIFASFLVLFGVSSLIVYNAQNFNEDTGFDYRDVLVVNLDPRNQPDSTVGTTLNLIRDHVKSYPQVSAVSFTGNNAPYSLNSAYTGLTYNQVNLGDVHTYWVELNTPTTLGLDIVEGRWFDQTDQVSKIQSVVINSKLKKELFGNDSAVGKKLYFGSRQDNPSEQAYWKVIGVTGNFKPFGEFQENVTGIFQLRKGDAENLTKTMLVKMRPGTRPSFEQKLVEDLTKITRSWTVDVNTMSKMRQKAHNMTLVPMLLFSTICFFLLVNVGLGLFGVLSMGIAKRRAEIGLRRALGASKSKISYQIVAEMCILASFSILIALFFAIQFPILHVFNITNNVYITSIPISIALIYVLVIACAAFPSIHASHVSPATALHDN